MSARTSMSRRDFLRVSPLKGPTISSACLAAAGVVCEACRDACPEAAIRFPPRLGAPPAPVLNRDACTECGDCVAVCPVGAISVAPHAETSDVG